MSKFKVGDRVRVYDSNGARDAKVTRFDESYVVVVNKDGYQWRVHPKQCRKLVKKQQNSLRCGDSKIKFKPEDFYFNFNDNRLLILPNSLQNSLAHLLFEQMAQQANAKLEQWLADAPVVYRQEYFDCPVWMYPASKTDKATHEALLVCIEPIKSDRNNTFEGDKK